LDTEKIVTELKQERERLARAIAALEGANPSGTVKKATVASMRPMKVKGKQGRGLTPEGRSDPERIYTAATPSDNVY
jgi:hypothetical protein